MQVNNRLVSQVLLSTVPGWFAGATFAYFRVLGLTLSADNGFFSWLGHDGVWGAWPWLGAAIFGCVVAGVTQRAKLLSQVLTARAKINSRFLSQVLLATVAGGVAGLAYSYSQFHWPPYVKNEHGYFVANVHGIIYWLIHSSPGPWPWLGAIICGSVRLAWWRA